jgi:transcriptional regulator with XRE-family HTH domain
MNISDIPTGAMLRALRGLSELTQKELGDLVGRSQQWISLVESDRLLPQQREAQKMNAVLRERIAAAGLFPEAKQ